MKKIILTAGLLLLATNSMAAAISGACAGASTSTKVSIAGGSNFIKTTFQTPCSANVVAAFGESTTAAYGSAGSSKGSCYQIGHTDAGVKAKTATCSPSNSDFTGTAVPTATDASALGST